MTLPALSLVTGLSLISGTALANDPQPLLTSPLEQSGAFSPPRRPEARPVPSERRESGPPARRQPAQIDITRLSSRNPDTLGVMSARQAGLAMNLWAATPSSEASAALVRFEPQLPAVRSVFLRLLAAQIAAPYPDEGHPEGMFFLARLDKLIGMGQLPLADAVLATADAGDPARYARQFDLSLILGDADLACAMMQSQPGIAPDLAPRIFCLARQGDWRAARLTFRAARAMGQLPQTRAELLALYLDDEYADGTQPPALADNPSALDFRLLEAIGHPVPTQGLPLGYAFADLDGSAGWKAQLEAAERLARASAIAADELVMIQSAQSPAASGGVWARAAAIQALDTALETGDAKRISAALTTAFARMSEAGLAPSLAGWYAKKPTLRDLEPEAAILDQRLRLWAGADPQRRPSTAEDRILAALLSGRPASEADRAEAQKGLVALFDLFAAEPSQTAQSDARLASGPALVAALAECDAGLSGDMARAERGLRRLRAIGLEADARKIAVQLWLRGDFLMRF